MVRREHRVLGGVAALVVLFLIFRNRALGGMEGHVGQDVAILQKLSEVSQQLRQVHEAAAALALEWKRMQADVTRLKEQIPGDREERSALSVKQVGERQQQDVISALISTQPVQPVSGTGRFRSDGRCGPKFPARDAPEFGECDPVADADQKGPCCNPNSGWCGNIRTVRWGHCDCIGCVDFSQTDQDRKHALIQSSVLKARETVVKPAEAAPPPPPAKTSAPLEWFRADGRCGPKYPSLSSPSYGECNPTVDSGKGHCCNPDDGWCGTDRTTHCGCPTCVDFSIHKNQHSTTCAKSFSAYNREAWGPLEDLCRPLFTNAQFTDGKNSVYRCIQNLGSKAQYCEGLNLMINPAFVKSGGWATKGSVAAICYSTLAVEALKDLPEPRSHVSEIAITLSLQDSFAPAFSCVSFGERVTVLATPSNDIIHDLYQIFQIVKLLSDPPLNAFEDAQVVWLQEPTNVGDWNSVFASKPMTLTGEQCYKHILLPPQQYSLPLFSFPLLSFLLLSFPPCRFFSSLSLHNEGCLFSFVNAIFFSHLTTVVHSV
eukprot:m.432662 g.432662  ORF g.432662 m.432662 type:complete len:544 (-) comp56753_c0_seq1:50-1681(-)